MNNSLIQKFHDSKICRVFEIIEFLNLQIFKFLL